MSMPHARSWGRCVSRAQSRNSRGANARPRSSRCRSRARTAPPADALSKCRPLDRHWAGGASCPPTNPRRTDRFMQYMMLIYANEKGWSQLTPEQQKQGMAAYMAYSEALRNAGVLISSNRLLNTDAATTVKVTDGKTQVLNGPYVDTREQLGGYFLIEAPDLDAAIAWAARCPGASHGAVEVRPLWAM